MKIFFISNFFLLVSMVVVAQIPTIVDTVEVDEVVIISTRPSEKVITDFYKCHDLTTIDEVSQRMEGISLVRRGAYAAEPQIHGRSGGQIEVTLNGMKMMGACTDKMDPVTAYVETSNLKSISVKQGADGLYMGSAIGGSYNLNFSEAGLGKDTIYGEISSGFRSNSLGWLTSGNFNLQHEKFGVMVNATLRDEGNYHTPTGNEVQYSQYSKANFFLSSAYQASAKSTLIFDILIDEARDVGYYALPMDVSKASAQIYSVQYLWQPTVIFTPVKSVLYFNKVFHEMDDTHRDSVAMHMDMPGWSKILGGFVETGLRLKNKQALKFKFDFYSHYSRAEMTMYPNNIDEPTMYMLTWPDTRKTRFGIFSEYSFNVNKYKLKYSGRIDFENTLPLSTTGISQFEAVGIEIQNHYNKIAGGFQFEAQRPLAKQYKITASYGYGQRLPSVTEQFGFYLFNALDGYDYLGNPDLQNEQSHELSLAIAGNYEKIKFEVKAFQNIIFHYIFGEIDSTLSSMTLDAFGVKNYTNYSTASLTGMDIMGQLQLNRHINILSTLNFTYGQFIGGEPMSQISPLKNFTSLGFWSNHFSVRFESELTAKQYRVNKNFGETSTNGYALLHLRLSKDFLIGTKKILSLNGAIENIFNTEYYEYLEWSQHRQLKPGRNFVITVKLKL